VRRVGRHLVREAVSLLGTTATDELVGHTALVPVQAGCWELLVVVRRSYQNVGIGSELVRCALEQSRRLGAQRIVLSVEATNVRARHVYERFGFEYASRCWNREMTMVRRTARLGIEKLRGHVSAGP